MNHQENKKESKLSIMAEKLGEKFDHIMHPREGEDYLAKEAKHQNGKTGPE